jgi:lambda family phage portal protein
MGGTSFKSAQSNAYNMSWNVFSEQTPDRDLKDGNSLQVLRKRSRQLIKDNLLIAGMQQSVINVVGSPNKIAVVSDNRIQQKQAQKVIDDFCENADINNRSLWQIVDEWTGASFSDGDILISLPIDNSREGVKTVVESIEANRVDTPSEYSADVLVNHGVKHDSEGKVLGYYVKKHDKVDSYGNNLANYNCIDRISGDRKISDLFKSPLNNRPRSSRQYPLLTPAMQTIKLLDDYLEAVLVGARVAACFSAFIKSSNPAGTFSGFTTDANGNVLDPQDGNATRRVQKLFPGQVFYLKPNEEIDFASPNRPNDNVDAFIVRLQKLIAMYLRIPYPILFLDLTEVNYSSWRGGANEMRKFINRWRWNLEKMITWILRTVLVEAGLLGLVRGDISDVTFNIRWPSSNILDPEKEARANKIALQNGTTTPQRICDEEGVDYEEILREAEADKLARLEMQARILKRKKELEAEYGIVFDPVAAESTESTESESSETGDNTGTEDQKERRKEDGNW